MALVKNKKVTLFAGSQIFLEIYLRIYFCEGHGKTQSTTVYHGADFPRVCLVVHTGFSCLSTL